MEEIIKAVLNSISSEDVLGDKALPVQEGQTSLPISKENFHQIKEGEGKVTFIDGGNAELFGAASFSLQFIRVASVSYPSKKREKQEFYLLVSFKEGKFTVKTFPDSLSELSFDSLDPALTNGNERIVANQIAGVCRRLAELQMTKGKKGFVVLDGNLQTKTQQEEELMKNLDLCALSKTTNILTNKGRVFAAVLNSLSEGSWSYHPVYSGGKLDTSFVKLNNNAKHVFRLDMNDPTKREELNGILKKQSNDPVFPGYPYGLLEADRLARVSKKEQEYLRTKFMTKFGKSWRNVKTYLRTKDAHEILDSIS